MRKVRMSLIALTALFATSYTLQAQEDMDVKVKDDKVKVEETMESENGNVTVENEMKVSEDKAKFKKEMEIGDEDVKIEKKIKIDENEVKIKKEVTIGDETVKTKEYIDLNEVEPEVEAGYSEIDAVALPQAVKDAIMNDFDAAKPQTVWIKEEGDVKTYKVALKSEEEIEYVYADHDGNWLEMDEEEVEVEAEIETEVEAEVEADDVEEIEDEVEEDDKK